MLLSSGLETEKPADSIFNPEFRIIEFLLSVDMYLLDITVSHPLYSR
jgi:hypothetical protein